MDGTQGGTGKHASAEGIEADAVANHGQRSDRGSGGKGLGKKRSREESRKLLGLDGDIDATVKAKPSTTISKSVLKMFAS